MGLGDLKTKCCQKSELELVEAALWGFRPIKKTPKYTYFHIKRKLRLYFPFLKKVLVVLFSDGSGT